MTQLLEQKETHVFYMYHMLPIRSRPDTLHKSKQLSMYMVLVDTLSADVPATNYNFDKPQL